MSTHVLVHHPAAPECHRSFVTYVVLGEEQMFFEGKIHARASLTESVATGHEQRYRDGPGFSRGDRDIGRQSYLHAPNSRPLRNGSQRGHPALQC